MMKELARIHAIVHGVVQGVGFRYFVVWRAEELNLTGWVRNRWDGTVEVLAEGSKEDLERLLEALRQGPRGARVERVEASWEDYRGEFSDFRVRY